MGTMLKRRLNRGGRGAEITFELDGRPCIAYEGETIAAALVAAEIRSFRLSPKLRQPRGFFCGTGTCFDCLVTVNGVPNVRSCMTDVKAGMRVDTGIRFGIGVENEKS